MNSKKLALIAILAAVSIGTNYAMMPIYNVKFMDLIVFVGGFCFGPLAGASIGVISWAVYGTLNPYGFSLVIWLSTMFSESIYGVAGGILRKNLNLNQLDVSRRDRVNIGLFFGMLGMFLTLLYDIITNVVFGFVSGWNVLFALIMGFMFGLIHMISNAFFFGLGCRPAINAIFKAVGGENPGISKK